MSRPVLLAALVLATVSVGVHAESQADAVVPLSGAAEKRTAVRLFDLASVRRLLTTIAGRRASMSGEQRAGAQTDLVRLVQAVAGGVENPSLTLDELDGAAAAQREPRLSATPGVSVRDAAAYQMLGLGYSVRETADVLNGRISVSALNRARRMLAMGGGRDAAADYLDGQYKRVEESRRQAEIAQMKRQNPQPAPFTAASTEVASVQTARESRPQAEIARTTGRPTLFDTAIARVARLYNLDEAIVHAVIATESAFRPAVVSSAGAIGLMQLMPGTARELGVNPWIPEQNIEGGVRYLLSLIRTFGTLDLALVAYNAGPGFAQRYVRGEVALYGETRDYVRKVLARLHALR